MTLALPPARPPGVPRLVELARGELLYRVYHRRYGVSAFKQAMAPGAEEMAQGRYGGARFDGTESHPFPFLYAASTPGAALAETLLRGMAFSERGTRTVLSVAISHLGCAPIEVLRELQLVDLRGGRALAALGATAALVHCSERHYATTRAWAHAIRTWCPQARGLVWRSRWEPEGDAVVLFGDRLVPQTDFLRPLGGRLRREFGRESGRNWLRAHLLEYHTDLR